MQFRFLVVVAAVAVVCATASLAAHHAIIRVYRVDEQLTIEGTLVSLVYRNPHSYLQVKAPDRLNQMRVWAVECGNHEQLKRNVSEAMLKPGDRLIVTGNAARDEGQWRLLLRTMQRPRDGWRWNEVNR
jgi:DNA/RNA endonuclease YhcR with UshA esterase domain